MQYRDRIPPAGWHGVFTIVETRLLPPAPHSSVMRFNPPIHGASQAGKPIRLFLSRLVDPVR